jgi:hypothetical protein
MRRTLSGINKAACILFTLSIIIQSCILDEFKFNEIKDIKMKEDWGMDIVSPLFSGYFEFKDLINTSDTLQVSQNEKVSGLRFPGGRVKTIPTRIIFEPFTFIDSLDFLIDGNYSLDSVGLEYLVTNGCPFPFNLKMRFFNNKNPGNSGAVVLPPSFFRANFGKGVVEPVKSRHFIKLNKNQMQSFTIANRVEFTSWFNNSDFIRNQDTLESDYPVEIAIILHGVVKRKNED